MSVPRYYGTKSTIVMILLIAWVSTAILLLRALHNASSMALWGWGIVCFACVVAPVVRVWTTWHQLKPYRHLIPCEARHILWGAASSFVMLGFMALWVMLMTQRF